MWNVSRRHLFLKVLGLISANHNLSSASFGPIPFCVSLLLFDWANGSAASQILPAEACHGWPRRLPFEKTGADQPHLANGAHIWFAYRLLRTAVYRRSLIARLGGTTRDELQTLREAERRRAGSSSGGQTGRGRKTSLKAFRSEVALCFIGVKNFFLMFPVF